jgi:hypothetical protein
VAKVATKPGKRKKIWRVETKVGQGMYSFSKYAHSTMSGVKRHPDPSDDSGLDFSTNKLISRSKWYFGFATLSQFKRWVYREDIRRRLQADGLQLSCYSVPEKFTKRSSFQAIFRKDKARLIEVRRVDFCDITC